MGLRRQGHAVLSVATDENQPAGAPGSSHLNAQYAAHIAARMRQQVLDCRRAFASWRPHVVHIELAGPSGHAAMEAASEEGLPITSYWHPLHEAVPTRERDSVMRSLHAFHGRALRTFVDSSSDAERLRAAGVRGVVLAGRGVDTRLFSPDARSSILRAAWNVTDDGVVLLHVGRLLAIKNVQLLARAAEAARAASPTARVVIVGDGPERDALRAQLPWAVFTGTLGDDTLAEVYASSDAFLFPSLADGFGNVVVEAMASGLAAVAFDRGAAARYIRDGENGRRIAELDEPGFIAAAVALAADPPAARLLGAAARASADAFSRSVAADLVERELRSVARV